MTKLISWCITHHASGHAGVYGSFCDGRDRIDEDKLCQFLVAHVVFDDTGDPYMEAPV